MKTLNKILCVGAAALTLLLGGCDRTIYNYKGMINGEQIKFEGTKSIGTGLNVLLVRRTDGRVIEYLDNQNNNLKLENVNVIVDGNTTYYKMDKIGRPIIEEAQKQFDSYLGKIKEEKIKQGLESIK